MTSDQMFRSVGSSVAGLLALAFAGAAQARPPIVAKVESLQMPAWVERGGVKASIKAGWAIYADDRVSTGDIGRLELTLIGEARVKLSGSAALTFSAPGADHSFMRLAAGAMHFTAPAVARADGMTLTVGKGLHANILAGQAWGRVDAQQDLLALLDGSVQIRGDGELRTLNEPQTVLMVPHFGPASPVIPVAKERLAQWLAQTEPVSGRPRLAADGRWDVSLHSGYNLKQLEAYACKVQARGFPSEIYPVREPGKQVWYRVAVRRFVSREDAMDFARLGKSLGSNDAWVLLPQQN